MKAAERVTIEDLDGAHHEALAAIRNESPVAWVPAIGGWVVTSRAACIAVMRDAAGFTVDDPRFSTAQVVGPSMLSLDGSEHQRHREPFAAAFRPGEVAHRYTALIERMARRHVADLAPRGEAELRSELAGPTAAAVAALSLGIERLDPGRLRGWYDEIVAAVERVSFGQPAGQSAAQAFSRLGSAIDDAARRPGSVLRDAAPKLSRDELISNAAVFLFGGIETSEGMTTNLLYHLLSDPAQLELVRGERTLIDAAVEESLRLEPAAARVDRYATRGVVLEGAEIGAGDLVVVSIAAANRDPSVFDDPDHFDIKRVNSRSHVAFAQGPHACLGAQLARIETRAVVDAVLDLLPGVELAHHESPTGTVFRKPRTLAARWPRHGRDWSD